MRHIAFLLVLLIFSTKPFAWSQTSKWEQAAEDSQAVYFIDMNSLRRQGDEVIFWQMKDLKTQDWNKVVNKGLKSVAMRFSANCQEGSMTLLSYAEYEKNMGLGSVVASSTINRSKPIYYVPGSVGARVVHWVCRR